MDKRKVWSRGIAPWAKVSAAKPNDMSSFFQIVEVENWLQKMVLSFLGTALSVSPLLTELQEPGSLTRVVSFHQIRACWLHILHLTGFLVSCLRIREQGCRAVLWNTHPWTGTRREPPHLLCEFWFPLLRTQVNLSMSGPEIPTLLFPICPWS